MPDTDARSLAILRDALAEAQATVRAYDTKAQIVGVGYIFALGIVGQIGALLPALPGPSLGIVFGAWTVVMVPIFLFGYVLYPTRKTAPAISRDTALQHVVYVESGRHATVEGLRAALARCDGIDEYCFEVLKVAKLRELKRRRFLRAMYAAGIAFAILFLSHFGRVRVEALG